MVTLVLFPTSVILSCPVSRDQIGIGAINHSNPNFLQHINNNALFIAVILYILKALPGILYKTFRKTPNKVSIKSRPVPIKV